MANFQYSKRQRGGRKDRPSRRKLNFGGKDDRPAALQSGLPLRPSKGTDSTVAVGKMAKYFDCAEVAETPEAHLIPRKSTTDKQYLKDFPQRVETEPVVLRHWQLDKASGKMVETTDTLNRVTWRSDRTLLNRTKPGADLGTFKREGAVREGQHTRKFTATEKETPLIEKVLGPAIDDEL